MAKRKYKSVVVTGATLERLHKRRVEMYDIRHLLETPIDDLIKEQEKIADTIRQGLKNNLY